MGCEHFALHKGSKWEILFSWTLQPTSGGTDAHQTLQTTNPCVDISQVYFFPTEAELKHKKLIPQLEDTLYTED